jgi:myo-inositol-1(or 4)-monophosphatase
MASFLDTSIEIAREAGALLANYFEKRVAFELKGEFDLVTEADRASEALIVERLRTHFPTHAIFAEETGAHEGSSEYCWYVDPLDGTTNFAHGFPVFNVTLALERAGEVIAGVVYDPLRQEMFFAEKGSGAYLNNRRIHVSKTAKLEESLISTGFPSRKRHLNGNIHFYHQMAMITHGVRRAGAAALDLAYVACGRTEGFWEFTLNPWDVAAGILLVQEAGGICSGMKNEPVGLRAPNILADNGLIHDQALTLFGEIFTNRYRYPIPQITAG